MANWSNPTLSSLYTDFLSQLKDRDVDIALQFDGTTSSNIPTNAIRWNSTSNRWNKWNGSSWAELTSTYALTGLSTTGNASIGGALSVTGSTSLGTATATTPATGDTSVNLATTAWVRNQSYATLASPSLTGTPTAPTAALSTNTTQLATTAFTLAQIANDAPTKSGTGATGTWGINISGNAATATSATSATSSTTQDRYSAGTTIATTAYVKNLFGADSVAGTLDWNDTSNVQPGTGPTLLLGTATNGPGDGNYYHAVNFEYAGKQGTQQITQLALSYATPANELRMRGRYSGSWSPWVRFLNTSNFNAYSPTLTGTGATGTWGINISGNAAAAFIASSSSTSYTFPDNSSSIPVYPVFVASSGSSNQILRTTSTGLYYVPSTGTLNATAYTGNGTALSNLSTFSQTAGTGADLLVNTYASYFYIDVVATGTKTIAWFSCTINHNNSTANDFIMGARIYDQTGGGTTVGTFDTGHSTGPYALSFNSVLHVALNATTIVGRTYRYQLFLYKTQANGPTYPNNGRITGVFL